MVRIIRVPRKTPLKDIPIDFPPLYNLHLEMIENKHKLKKSTPILAPDKYKEKVPGKFLFTQSDVRAGLHRTEEAIKAKTKKRKGQRLESHSFESDEEEKGESVANKENERELELDDTELDMLADLGEDDELEEDDGDEEDYPEEDYISAPERKEVNVNKAKDDDKEDDVSIADYDDEEEDPYAHLTPEQRERLEHDEYLARFRILKKKYPERTDIPIDYNEFSDIEIMKRSYDRILKEISSDENIANLRIYLYGSFMFIEFACTKWLGIDMTGLAKHQMKSRMKYERLLIELGEREYLDWGGSWPIEMRLIMLVLFQTALFYIGKILTKSMGSGAGLFFKIITGQNIPTVEEETKTVNGGTRKSKGMRGPKINIDDL